MGALADAFAKAVTGKGLTAEGMAAAMKEILAGEGDPSLIAGLAVALRMKGETENELLGAAQAMRRACVQVSVPGAGVLVDTCGTGGDGLGTFNVSTASAFVVAACGVRVAKHGNRAVSSRAGSADVLEALGVKLDQPAEAVAEAIQRVGIGFLFAPKHHQALRHAAPVRRTLGVRTFFNLLGPLSNPASASHQLVGVYDRTKIQLMAHVLGLLGSTRAWVVHGAGGLDEISPLGATEVAEFFEGRVVSRTVDPEDFGLRVLDTASLQGGDADENAQIMRAVLAGAADPRKDVVAMNAAAVLYLAGHSDNLRAATEAALAAMHNGAALKVLDSLIAFQATDA